jgi:uncharacterized membrane protein
LKDSRWLVYGILSSVGYGVWAFFDKLSAFQSPFLNNFIIYGTAFVIVLTLVRPRQLPPISALISGVFGGVINLLALMALQSRQLLTVYPFVAAGGLVYFAIVYLSKRPAYSRLQSLGVVSGGILAVIGILISGLAYSSDYGIGIGPSGSVLLLVGILITISTGLWIYFAGHAITEEKCDPLIAGFWILLASFGVSALGLLLDLPSSVAIELSPDQLYPVAAGVLIFIGEMFAYYAFGGIRDNPSVARSSTVAVLSNSEIVPVVLLSLLVLKEYDLLAIIGIVLLAIGLFVLNYSE